MTTRCSGTSEKDNAPVEETIFFSSISIPGKDVGKDPVAITIFFAEKDCRFSFSYTTTLFSEKGTPLPFR